MTPSSYLAFMLQIQPNDLDFERLGMIFRVTRIDMIVLFRVIRLSKNHDLNMFHFVSF